MKLSTAITVGLIALSISSCGKKEKEVVVPPAPTRTASPFTPSSAGNITALQLKFWDRANSELDSLIESNSDLLASKDSSAYREAYLDYTSSRAVICKKSGLSGGYSEYQWVSKSIHKAVNKTLLYSLNFKTL